MGDHWTFQLLETVLAAVRLDLYPVRAVRRYWEPYIRCRSLSGMMGEVGTGVAIQMAWRCWGGLCLVCLWYLKKEAPLEACIMPLHRMCRASQASVGSGPQALDRWGLLHPVT